MLVRNESPCTRGAHGVQGEAGVKLVVNQLYAAVEVYARELNGEG